VRAGATGLSCTLIVWTTTASAQQNVDRLPSLGATGAPSATTSSPDAPSREQPVRSPAPAALEPAGDTISARDAPRPRAASTPTSAVTACTAIDDETTRDACWRSYRAELAYREQSLAQRERALAWQHLSTIGIFFVVLGLVLAGLYFAWLQFRADTRRDGGAAAQASSVELSAGGLKLTSPVLGTIILALSLGFFYLYLVHVYPIHELN
jgi:hypothetical protein